MHSLLPFSLLLLLLVALLLSSVSFTPTGSNPRHGPTRHERRAHLRERADSSPTPSKLITSPLIYSKYEKSTSTYRPDTYPHLTTSSGSWIWTGADWWTSGFFPGTLYLLNERKNLCPSSTGTDWLSKGRKWSEGLVPLESYNTVGHDTGFLAYPFMAELTVNPNNATAKAAIKAFAKQLADRFDAKVGCARSFDSSPPDFVVIMDNMMNLELLHTARHLFNITHYLQVAAFHASNTAVNHVRPDGSSYHVVDYNQADGQVLRKYTAQGYKDWSTWSRGQAWGIYGFTSMYTNTGYLPFLNVGRRMGQKWLSRLAEDPSGVPKWDFDAPDPAPRDTSAAAIASVAFLELYKAETSRGNSTGAAYWRDNAVKVLSTTADKHFQSSSSWDAILSAGTSNYPIGIHDTGLVYGDYYFVKAGNIMIELGLIGC